MNKKFKECLLEVYLGEQAGEMIFESMLAMAEDDNQRYIFSNMLQLETEGKAIMRPLLEFDDPMVCYFGLASAPSLGY